jgi:DNA-binding MarR family transcriptional regulator
MNVLPRKEIPDGILKDSILAHVAAAYFSVGKRLERKTQCSATRGFVLSALRDGETPNQNQIATQLGIDRTVVHRTIKSLVLEGLVSEQKPTSGRAIQLQLTPKGKKYRERLIEARAAADESVRRQMSSQECEVLLKLLKLVAECEF